MFAVKGFLAVVFIAQCGHFFDEVHVKMVVSIPNFLQSSDFLFPPCGELVVNFMEGTFVSVACWFCSRRFFLGWFNGSAFCLTEFESGTPVIVIVSLIHILCLCVWCVTCQERTSSYITVARPLFPGVETRRVSLTLPVAINSCTMT